jgi:replicative DNA helicase
MAVIVDAGAPPGFRTPPHSPDAEQAVLGAILYRNDIFNAISGYLHAEHFYQPVHRRIYQSIEALVSAGKQADHITLLRAFANDEELRELDGTNYMLGLAELGMVSQLDAEHYARHVHDLAVKRRLIQLGEDWSIRPTTRRTRRRRWISCPGPRGCCARCRPRSWTSCRASI